MSARPREELSISAMLRLALTSGRPETVERHLSRLPGPDVTDREGRTPLMIAASSGRYEICELLLQHGARRDLRDASGRTAQDHAAAAGHPACAALLAPQAMPEDYIELAESGDGWLAEDELALSDGDSSVAHAAARAQSALARHAAETLDSDWSDIEIEVPTPVADPRRARARTRLTVRFRRGRNGASTSDGELPADLGGNADQVLSSLSLEQIVMGSDASPRLKRAIRRSAAARQSALEFLCDDEAERRLTEGGFAIADYFELVDVVNAFTVLAHRLRPVEAGARGVAVKATSRKDEPRTPPALDAETELHRATLARVVLNGATSPGLRRAMAKSKLGSMTVDAFLLEDEPERLFGETLTGKEILELTDLVNAYTSLVFLERRGA